MTVKVLKLCGILIFALKISVLGEYVFHDDFETDTLNTTRWYTANYKAKDWQFNEELVRNGSGTLIITAQKVSG